VSVLAFVHALLSGQPDQKCTLATHALGKPDTGLQAVACVHSIVPNRLRICLMHTLHSRFTMVPASFAGSCIVLIPESSSRFTKGSTDCGGQLLNVGSCNVAISQWVQ